MALCLVRSRDERLVDSCVLGALRRGVKDRGAAVLLVPSFPQALAAQRVLASEGDLALGVETTTPSAWVRDIWERWGDGRALADACVLTVLAYEALRAATLEERGPLALLPATVDVVAKLVNRSLPWLPLRETGSVDLAACERAGLTHAESCLVRMAGRTAQGLHAHGYVAPSEASAMLAQLLAEADVVPPHVVVAGFPWMGRADRDLLGKLGKVGTVTFVADVVEGPASGRVRQLLDLLEQEQGGLRCDGEWQEGNSGDQHSSGVSDGKKLLREEPLQELLDALFGDESCGQEARDAVELLLPAGPLAEAELVAEHVAKLVEQMPHSEGTESPSVVVAVGDAERAWRELVPKLEERGVATRTQWTSPLAESSSAQAFFGYAMQVAYLSELAATWPEPAEGLEGPVPQLGDMSWWPPRELVDFLFEDMAHMEPHKVWHLDALWRGNRLLTPARVLEMLQSERLTSAPVARATQELLRGRLGSAASKLLAPYGAAGSPARDAVADKSCAVLQSVLQLSGTLRRLGVSFNPEHPEERPLTEVVSLMGWAAAGRQVVARIGVGSAQEQARVLVTTMEQAAKMGAATADVAVVCGLTSVEKPVEGKENVLQAMLELLGVEPKADPLAHARAEFRALLGVARSRVVLERATADADGEETYPSVMLSELLAACGVSETSLAHAFRSERLVSQNLSRSGNGAKSVGQDSPAPAGRLTDASRELVFVPQAGKDTLPDGLPILSASQIESYLECPYKWFSLRRLHLGTVDAGHSALEMGTFAHRVLEVTHRELLLRALEAEYGPLSLEELLALVDKDPARHIPGSRVEKDGLDEAQTALKLEFELHREHMYLERSPRAGQQLLIAHDSAERAQEQRLEEDLLSSLEYETRILEGFEPRFFEWSFGRHELVKYAGAYFTGTIDRIDVSPHGTAVIIDYKHKNPLVFAKEYDALQEGVLEGTLLPSRVQSLIYAQVVRRAFEGRLRLVGSVYLSSKAPHALAGVADESVVDLVFGRVSAKRLPCVSVPPNDEGEPGMNDLLDRTEELIAEQVQQMLAGNVEARPRDQHSCDYCPVMQCEKRMAR